LNNGISANNIDFPIQSCATGIATGYYWGCAAQLAHSIWEIHNWGEDTPVNICGIVCEGNLKGLISKWPRKWDGRFRCDSKVPGIVGHDIKLSRNGAMESAIKDFINKAITSGRLKPQDFHC
jgi:hypothetical protein